MAFCSFGGEEDPCGAVEWAAHDSSMVPLQHCKRDMSSWLKEKYGGSGASGSRGRPTSKSSDPKKAEFPSPCDHSHDMSCSDCQNIKNVLKDIQKKLESKELELTKDQQERAKWEFEHAVSDIEAWKTHLLRAFHQDQAKQDALSQLDEKTIIVINHWAMKLLPMKFRETQSQWFAKRGLSWHFSAVIHNSGHPDCQAEGNGEHVIHTYVAAFDDCKQDWFSVTCIIE
ncbi:hypothetical protein ACROYT_G030658 [Oculina patagonica]